MSTYAVYRPSGEIVRIVGCPAADKKSQVIGNEKITEVDNAVKTDTHWVDTHGDIKEKKALPYKVDKPSIQADGKDTVRITGIPKGAEVTWPDFVTSEMVDGVLEFSVDLPGTYTIEVMTVPYLLTEIKIEAILTT